MTRFRSIAAAAVFGLFGFINVNAQENKLKITPLGRLAVDAAAYVSHDDDFVAGAAIPEARLGLKGDYGIYTAKIEIGISYGKLTLKDIYLQARFRPYFLLRAGNLLHHYGLQSAYNSSMKSTMIMPTSNAVYDFPRSIGVMGIYNRDELFGALSLTVENKATTLNTTEMGRTGWGAIGRFVYRPLTDNGAIAQIGWSGAFLSPQYNSDEALNHKSFEFSANFPTDVARVEAVNALVPDARNLFKFTPEILLAKGRFALESQYYFNRVSRKNGQRDYTTYGAYGILRTQLIGGDYRYYAADARLDTPSPKSLEFVVGYNYTCLTDASAVISGGRVSDISTTLNWYINKYIIWRLRYSYTHGWDREDNRAVDLGAFQTRIQFIF